MSGMINGLGPLALFGIASAFLSTIAYLPYIIETVRGQTRPQRASWLIWSVLSMIAFASQVYEGATDSLWFAGAQVVGTFVIFLLSVPYGTGGFLSRKDCTVMLLALGGLVAWYFMETAVYALAITITISLLGGLVTISKSYHAPSSETTSTWILCFLASICAILSVGTVDWVILAYPMYLLTLNGAIVLAIWFGRTRRPVFATIRY